MAADLTLFLEISLIIILAVLISSLVKLLRQPLIIGYILTGILVSPLFLDVVKSADTLATFSQLGIAFLLFIVGINLNPRAFKDVGGVALATGLGQVLFTAIIGFILSLALGFSVIPALYISIALTFSSTILIMKLLSDKHALGTLYGKISIGLLLVQDLIVILMLVTISTFSKGIALPNLILQLASKGVGLIILIFLVSYFVLPKIKKFVGDSQEYLFIFAIAWLFACASLFSYAGFSLEIGALIAGIALSISPFHHEISSKVRPLRDFFIVLFFIFLGSQISFGNITAYLLAAVIFSLFVLIGNPLIVMIVMGLLGFTKRNSFMVGLIVAQISEFSLILVALGVRLGHISQDILSLVTVVGLITIAGSTYMILYAEKLYAKFSKYLFIFERKGSKIDEHLPPEKDYDIILFGCNRVGFDLLEAFKRRKDNFVVIDFNPNTIMDLKKEKIPCRYGDATDIELLNELNFEKAKMIVSTIPTLEINLFLIHEIKKTNQKPIIIAVSHDIDDTNKLYKAGASYVLMPHFLGGHFVSDMIEKNKFDLKEYLKEQKEHKKILEERKKKGHEHPEVPRNNH